MIHLTIRFCNSAFLSPDSKNRLGAEWFTNDVSRPMKGKVAVQRAAMHKALACLAQRRYHLRIGWKRNRILWAFKYSSVQHTIVYFCSSTAGFHDYRKKWTLDLHHRAHRHEPSGISEWRRDLIICHLFISCCSPSASDRHPIIGSLYLSKMNKFMFRFFFFCSHSWLAASFKNNKKSQSLFASLNESLIHKAKWMNDSWNPNERLSQIARFLV